MDFEIHPLKGVNNVRFGMHAKMVRRLVGGNFREFRRGDEVFPSDYDPDIGMFCYYDPDGLLEAMEFHEPARVLLHGINLLSLHHSDVIPLLSRLDPHFSADSEGAGFRTLSIGIYAPDMPGDGDEEDDGEEYVPIEAVLVGRENYFDFLDDLNG